MKEDRQTNTPPLICSAQNAEELPTPLRNSYWVLPGQLLAGEYPGEVEPEITGKKLRALIGGGIRTFVDLTDEGEVNEDAKVIPAYRSVLRQVSEEESIQTTYANIPIEDRGYRLLGRCVVFWMSLTDPLLTRIRCMSTAGLAAAEPGRWLGVI